MKLTPLDLRKQQFKKKFGGGYDPEEVRGFIEKLATDWDDVLESQRQAESRVRELEAKLKHYEKVELALQEALDQARETTRRAEEAADRRSKLIIEEAELRAQRMLQDAEQERYNVRQDLVKLSSRQAEIGARLRAFLMSEMEILAQFQSEDPVGFIKLKSAGETSGALAAPKARLQAPVEVPDAEVRPVEPPAPASPEADGSPAAPRPEPKPSQPAAQPAAPEPDSTLTTPSARRFTTPVAPTSEHDEADRPEPPRAPTEPQRPAPQPAEAHHAEAKPPEARPSEGNAKASDTAEPTPKATAPTDGPAPTYRDLLSGRSGSAAEPTDTETGNPFSTPFFQSPFFQKGDGSPTPGPSEPAPGSDAAQGWSLRSLVTGDDEDDAGSVVASDDERERIRRILNDLD